MKKVLATVSAVAIAMLALAGTAHASVQHTISSTNSKSNCLYVGSDGPHIGVKALNSAMSAVRTTASCLETFDNPMATWGQWEAPWQFTDPTWMAWVRADPHRQIVLGQDLVPWEATGQSGAPVSNPLAWEAQGASGAFNGHARALAEELVRAGVFAGGRTLVVRLGIEANGNWEADYVGNTSTEAKLWGETYANEVTAMRSVPGTHFLFVWNPNGNYSSGVNNFSWYPGNKYVDIIGSDSYDQDATNGLPVNKEGFNAFAAHGAPSLDSILSFAAANHKPMSFPEWGLVDGVSGDDSAYIAGMGNLFRTRNFAFQSYFDCGCDSITPLNGKVPNSVHTFTQYFQTP